MDSGCGLEAGQEDTIFLPMHSRKIDNKGNSILLSGDPSYSSTQGYMTIWMAAVALEASFDFGTDIQIGGGAAVDWQDEEIDEE